MYTNFQTVYEPELYHHGIKGQKWGIRRYQNTDGSLTEAGKQRYLNKENREKYFNALRDGWVNSLNEAYDKGGFKTKKLDKTFRKKIDKYFSDYENGDLDENNDRLFEYIGKSLETVYSYAREHNLTEKEKDFYKAYAYDLTSYD